MLHKTSSRVTLDPIPDAYAGPGIIIGTAWPIVILTFFIVLWRFYSIRSPRTYLLFLSVLLNIADCANITWARTTPRFELDIDSHFKMAIVFAQLKMAMVGSAGAWRFGQVFRQKTHKIIVIWGLSIFFMCWATAESILGCVEVNQQGHVSKNYWGMVVGIPAVYIVAGALTFTRVLKQMEDDLATSISNIPKGRSQQHSTFVYLRYSNNAAMAMTLLCAVSGLIVSQAWDSITNLYVLPGILLLSTIWIFAESMFEVFTSIQKVAPRSAIASGSASG
ncbi:hypothetical protein DFS34DRAFT_631956 [Phlyctochytrium arcticum]|nr:hypothetical protein DFS34DRAFT_631956 [Phlyctochytrium arcticum]